MRLPGVIETECYGDAMETMQNCQSKESTTWSCWTKKQMCQLEPTQSCQLKLHLYMSVIGAHIWFKHKTVSAHAIYICHRWYITDV